MIRIRESQMEALDDHMNEALRQALCVRYREIAAREGLPLSDETIEDRVRIGVRKARRYGVTRGSTLTGFVGMAVFLDPDFDEHPPIQEILADRQMKPEARVRLVGTLVLSRLSSPGAEG